MVKIRHVAVNYLQFSRELEDCFAESLIFQHSPCKGVTLPQNLFLSIFGIEILLSLHFSILFLLSLLKMGSDKNYL